MHSLSPRAPAESREEITSCSVLRDAQATGPTALSTADLLAAALDQARHELTDLRHSAHAAARRIAALEQSNASLRATVGRLTTQEAQARLYANHDELTGLPNRRLLKDRLDQALAQSARVRCEVVLILIDLDDFKAVNDQLGHTAGDQVLRTVAARLIASTRSADTACRFGGDEFIVMWPVVNEAPASDAVLGKLHQALSAPYRVDAFEIVMHSSMGVAVAPHDGDCIEDLLRKADRDLYKSKATRKRAAITRLSATRHDQASRMCCAVTRAE